MIPIFEQSRGSGIGYGRDDFLKRFDKILADRTSNNPNISFAFILYDLSDQAIKRVLKDNEVFTKLDRLSGEELNIFYMHSSNKDDRSFNITVLEELGFEENVDIPGILFFSFENGMAKDIEYIELTTSKDLHIFQELHSIISDRVSKNKQRPPKKTVGGNPLRVIRSAATYIAQETVKAVVRAGLNHLPF